MIPIGVVYPFESQSIGFLLCWKKHLDNLIRKCPCSALRRSMHYLVKATRAKEMNAADYGNTS